MPARDFRRHTPARSGHSHVGRSPIAVDVHRPGLARRAGPFELRATAIERGLPPSGVRCNPARGQRLGQEPCGLAHAKRVGQAAEQHAQPLPRDPHHERVRAQREVGERAEQPADLHARTIRARDAHAQRDAGQSPRRLTIDAQDPARIGRGVAAFAALGATPRTRLERLDAAGRWRRARGERQRTRQCAERETMCARAHAAASAASTATATSPGVCPVVTMR